MFKSGIKIKPKNIDKLDIKPRQRTDDIKVSWKQKERNIHYSK